MGQILAHPTRLLTALLIANLPSERARRAEAMGQKASKLRFMTEN